MTTTTPAPATPGQGDAGAGPTITAVRAWVMRAPVDPPWQIATVLYTHMHATFVEVELSDGSVGWGECLVREAPGATKAVVDEVFAPFLVGQDAGRVQGLWDEMWWLFRTRGHTRGIVVEALAGVDIAIWDALGRSSGQSISRMLRGTGRAELAAYASSVMVVDEAETTRQVERLLADGYRAIKVKVGQDVALDARRIHLTRELVGEDVEIMVDVNCNFSTTQAIDFIGRIRQARVSWVEEPVLPDDLPGYRRIAAACPEVPLAAGEAEFTTAGFREFCEGKVLQVFQPDVARAGGITGWLRIAALADAYGIPVAPHVGASAGICAAASVQVSAAVPNFRIYEHMYLEHPLQDCFVEGPIRPLDGTVQVPQGPGLGLTVDTAKLDRLKA